MKVDENIIFEILGKLKKEELIEHLKSSFYEMDDRQRRNVFIELQNSHVNKNMTPQGLYSMILKFYDKSVKGHYYAPFPMNSENFTDIPNETDEWFSELSYYLDEASKLVEKKKYTMGKKCFEILYNLIEQTENGEVVFAHEYGTWMITAKFDYNRAYSTALSHIE